MNKTNRIEIRVSNADKAKLQKAGRDRKNLSAFLVSAGLEAIRYRRVLDRLRALDKTFKRTAFLKAAEQAIADAERKMKELA